MSGVLCHGLDSDGLAKPQPSAVAHQGPNFRVRLDNMIIRMHARLTPRVSHSHVPLCRSVQEPMDGFSQTPFLETLPPLSALSVPTACAEAAELY